jgi:hypothetical protein
MKNTLVQTWIRSFESLLKTPIILLPFIITAFIEGLTLEILYFSPRKPLAYIFNPIVTKFFGAASTHYPGNLLVLPNLFYYAQVVIYIAVGVMLTAISINVYKNVRLGLPLRTNALIKNATRTYGTFAVYGILMVALLFAVKKVDTFILSQMVRFGAQFAPNRTVQLFAFAMPMFFFITNILLQVFFILVLPLIVLQKKTLLLSLKESLSLAWRNFVTLFCLIGVPYLLYLPIFIVKSVSTKVVYLTAPEIILVVTILGIILTVFVDCFIIICASQWLWEKQKEKLAT